MYKINYNDVSAFSDLENVTDTLSCTHDAIIIFYNEINCLIFELPLKILFTNFSSKSSLKNIFNNNKNISSIFK